MAESSFFRRRPAPATLVGAVLNVWLMVNYHLLAGGTVKLISALTELGEQNAGA